MYCNYNCIWKQVGAKDGGTTYIVESTTPIKEV